MSRPYGIFEDSRLGHPLQNLVEGDFKSRQEAQERIWEMMDEEEVPDLETDAADYSIRQYNPENFQV